VGEVDKTFHRRLVGKYADDAARYKWLRSNLHRLMIDTATTADGLTYTTEVMLRADIDFELEATMIDELVDVAIELEG
jgi:hypothetical protein